MEVLRDIAKLSKYKPSTGLKLELFNLVQENKVHRIEAIEHFEKSGKKGQFYVIYKRLKDSLLKGITDNSFKNISPSNQIRFKIWRKHLQAKILIQAGRRIAGIKLATETITLSEKHDQLEVIQSLCIRLIHHYSTIQPDLQKFHKYQTKLAQVTLIFNDAIKARSVFFDLTLCYYKKKNLQHIPKVIYELEKIALRNNHNGFRYYFYSTINLYYQLVNQQEKVIANNEVAYNFFTNQDKKLPYIYKFNFLSDLIPIYLIQQKFAKAETSIKNCLHLPPENSFNHHMILVYQAYLGFRSNKPKITQHAYKLAHETPTKFDSTIIDQRWHLIKGYLALYHKLGLLHFDKPFRLTSFLNFQEKQEDHDQKANLIIIELLHLLVDKKHPVFLAKLDRIEQFISTRFKAHNYKRTRYFLRMLKSVVKGNYHRKLAIAHAERQYKKLTKSAEEFDVNATEREIVPYEILWDLVLKQLR